MLIQHYARTCRAFNGRSWGLPNQPAVDWLDKWGCGVVVYWGFEEKLVDTISDYDSFKQTNRRWPPRTPEEATETEATYEWYEKEIPAIKAAMVSTWGEEPLHRLEDKIMHLTEDDYLYLVEELGDLSTR